MNPGKTDKHLKIGMIGCGVVGSQVARLMLESSEDLNARSGATLELVKIAVRDVKTERPGINPAILTTDADSVVNDPDIDIVIEVMGGIEPARTLVLQAMQNGKSVVTANKAMLGRHGAEMFKAAMKNKVDLYYEASVGGAIPILRPMGESLAGDYVRRVMGIVNGTTNFILTKMDESGASFADALKEAQALGYAEADPTADVEGFDAAAKIAILATLAYHTEVIDTEVSREGITGITAEDVAVAKSLGLVVKLIAIAELNNKEEISVRVHPTMLARTHPLASVRDSYNAVFVQAESAGDLMFYGRGAGGAPTASAILGDLVEVARHKVDGGLGAPETDYADLDMAPIGSMPTRYLIRLEVLDIPGVLASVANTFANHNISIQTVRQTGRDERAELIVMTHMALDKDLANTVAALADLDTVKEVASVIRVEGTLS